MCKQSWISQNFVESSESVNNHECLKKMNKNDAQLVLRQWLTNLNLENDLLNSELNLSLSIHNWVCCIKKNLFNVSQSFNLRLEENKNILNYLRQDCFPNFLTSSSLYPESTLSNRLSAMFPDSTTISFSSVDARRIFFSVDSITFFKLCLAAPSWLSSIRRDSTSLNWTLVSLPRLRMAALVFSI